MQARHIEMMSSSEKPSRIGTALMMYSTTKTFSFLPKSLGSQPSSAMPMMVIGVPGMEESSEVDSEKSAPPMMKNTSSASAAVMSW